MDNLVLLLKANNFFDGQMISTDATVLRASDITEHGIHIEALEEPEWLVNLPELWSEGDEYKPLSKIRIDLKVTRILKEITVIGNVRLSIQSQCSRCVEAVRIELNPLVSLVLSPSDKLKNEEEDIEHETYQGDEIDLGNYLREQLAISLPVKVVCIEDCKGLCTSCGTNLNIENCSCDKEQIDQRFAILKDLKI